MPAVISSVRALGPYRIGKYVAEGARCAETLRRPQEPARGGSPPAHLLDGGQHLFLLGGIGLEYVLDEGLLDA